MKGLAAALAGPLVVLAGGAVVLSRPWTSPLPMRVLVQWTAADPQDWIETDCVSWRDLPQRPVPAPGELGGIDNEPGWVFALNVQGVEFAGYDHYATRQEGEDCYVYTWKDDPGDYAPDRYLGKAWRFRPLAPDPRIGGAYNTRQTQIVYAGAYWWDYYSGLGAENIELRSWSDFNPPTGARHGVWVADDLVAPHQEARSSRSWQEWTDGLPSTEIDSSGRLRDQRKAGRWIKAAGTKTFNLRDIDLASGVHAAVTLANEDEATKDSPGAGETETSSAIAANSDTLQWIHTTASTQPNNAAWPTGDYRCQIVAANVGADLSYGYRTCGSANGHFARVDSGLTTDSETKTATQACQTGSQTFLFSTGSTTWSTGAAGDRFEALLGVTRGPTHATQTMQMVYNSSAFCDGPWAEDPSGAPPRRTIRIGQADSTAFEDDSTNCATAIDRNSGLKCETVDVGTR